MLDFPLRDKSNDKCRRSDHTLNFQSIKMNTFRPKNEVTKMTLRFLLL